jgi:hypothetical protein
MYEIGSTSRLEGSPLAWIFMYTAACLAAAAMLSTLRDDTGIIRLTSGLLRAAPWL